jgi:hypothetical protein
MKLLYRTAEWHAFAKLRLHTEKTLQHLETLTTELGQLMRKFRDATESGFVTFELPKETEARKRRQKSGKGKEKADGSTSGRKPKILNLSTYKWHALGDYVRTIRLFGGTDGFSTQVVSNIYFYISDFFTTSGCQGELAHKVVKRLYGSTNKRHAEQQIAKRYQRLERARLALDRKQLYARTQQKLMDNKDDQVEGDSDLQYHISQSKNQPLDIFDTIRKNRGDPAFHVCLTDFNHCDF